MSTQPSKLEICRQLYEEGAFDPQIAKELGLTIKAFHDLIDSNDGFAQFVEMGRTLSMAHWYDLVRVNITNKSFNTAAWSLVMKNNYGWADKIEQKLEDLSQYDAEQLKHIYRQKVKELAKTNPELAEAFASA